MFNSYTAMPLIGPLELQNSYLPANANGLSDENGWCCGGIGPLGGEITAAIWPLVAPLGDYGNGKRGSPLSTPGLPGRAWSVNSAGACVGGYEVRVGLLPQEHAFLTRPGQPSMTLDGVLGTPISVARHINDAGLIVGEAGTDNNALEAFAWDGKGSPRFLGRLAGHNSSTARHVNQSGTIVGFSSDVSNQARAFIDRGAGLEDLGRDVSLMGISINDHGVVAGSVKIGGLTARAAIVDTTKSPFEWTQIDNTAVGPEGSIAVDINNHGDVVGYWPLAGPNFESIPFIYSDGTLTPLNTLDIRWPLSPSTGLPLSGGAITRPKAIDDRGRILADTEGLAALLSPIAPRFRSGSQILKILFGIINDAPGLGWGPNGPVPVGPWGPLVGKDRDVLIALGLRDLAALIDSADARHALHRVALEMLEGAAKEMRRTFENERRR